MRAVLQWLAVACILGPLLFGWGVAFVYGVWGLSPDFHSDGAVVFCLVAVFGVGWILLEATERIRLSEEEDDESQVGFH